MDTSTYIHLCIHPKLSIEDEQSTKSMRLLNYGLLFKTQEAKSIYNDYFWGVIYALFYKFVLSQVPTMRKNMK